MVRSAGLVSIRIPPGSHNGDAASKAAAIAHQLVGREVRAGDVLVLPGWPRLLVDQTHPRGTVEVRADSRVEVWWPPVRRAGPVDVLFVVEGSFTMGRGRAGATGLDRATWAIESILLNARSAIGSAGILVHGTEPRLTEAPAGPDELNPHVIHRVEPRGTFDLDRAVGAGVALLCLLDGSAPRELVVVTDGHGFPSDVERAALEAARRSVRVHVFVTDPEGPGTETAGALDLAEAAFGIVTADPARLVETLAEAAEVSYTFHPLPPPAPVAPGESEFEIVIEKIDEERP